MPAAKQPRAGILLDTMGRANRRHADKSCSACGVTFRPRCATTRFCSRPCARTINGGHNRKEECWWVNAKGYIEGRVWIDGRQVRVKQHRYVAERHLGRRLLTSEDVHHKDGDKTNNDPSNLEVLPHGEHARISNIGQVRSPPVRAAWQAALEAIEAMGGRAA